MFIEDPIDTSMPEHVETWERQAPVVRAEILTTVKGVLHDVLTERNGMYFEQTEEGLEALTAVLTKELGERLSN